MKTSGIRWFVPMPAILLGFFLGSAVGQAPLDPSELLPPEELLPPFHVDDPAVAAVLQKIEGISPYVAPDLELKRDHNYANTPVDVEPYRGVRPFKEHFLLQMEYTGPGRTYPEPDVDTVRLGFLGPIVPTVSVATGGMSHEEPMGVQMLRGAQLAIEQANARGGYLKKGIPFELMVHNDNGLWGASGNEITNMVYKEGVWAILGSIDGANSHIAIRVALKTEVTMLNTGDTDPTFIETNIPWVFRCISDDRQMGYLLVDYLYRKADFKRVAIIRSSNRYGRFGVREIVDGSRRMGRPIVIEMAYKVGDTDFTLQLERIKAVNPDAIVHWGDDVEGAHILKQMRAMGMDQPFFGCDRHLAPEFAEAVGELAEGVWVTCPWNPKRQDPKLEAFRRIFYKRFGVEPDTYAAHAYDGMNMLIWAVQVAGLNRARIRDVLAYRAKPWPGVTGDIIWSSAMDDVGEVTLAHFENGRWVYYTREELGVPRGYIPARDRVSREAAHSLDTTED
ncbi:MAG TPA: ABC transporter substrate-binding protein [Acidobacteriota bacterium]|nr:ABC transporter substrate-binding protein [Acidobacteriota bacterium]HRV07680.1 ABC transporter substrate-binding protein [Acidobacteriota bacterium]